MSGFGSALARGLRLGVRHPLDIVNPMAFFVIVTFLIALTVGGVADAIRDALGIAILWIVVLLSTMLASASAYAQDFEDGTLELTIAHQNPLYASVLGSLVSRWLLNSLPILLLVPLGAWMMNLDVSLYWLLLVSLTAGSVVFTLFGVLGATLTLGIGRNGMLSALLVLPLYVPVLLLGVGAGQRYANGEPFEFALIGTFAIALALLTFLPFAIAALLRASQEY